MTLYSKETYLIDKAITNYLESKDNTEVDPEALNSIIQEIESQVTGNAENICKLIRNIESNVICYDDELKRLEKNKKQDLKKIESLKTFLEPYVKEKNIKQLGTFKVSFRKSQKVNILDEGLIPEDFKQYNEILKIDKRKIKELLKTQEIDGCELLTNQNLLIK
jgi:hypothetical protein